MTQASDYCWEYRVTSPGEMWTKVCLAQMEETIPPQSSLTNQKMYWGYLGIRVQGLFRGPTSNVVASPDMLSQPQHEWGVMKTASPGFPLNLQVAPLATVSALAVIVHCSHGRGLRTFMSCLSLVISFYFSGLVNLPPPKKESFLFSHVATQQKLNQLIDSSMLKIPDQGCEIFKGIVSCDRKFDIWS